MASKNQTVKGDQVVKEKKPRKAPVKGATRRGIIESIDYHTTMLSQSEVKLIEWDKKQEEKANKVPTEIVKGFRGSLLRLSEETLQRRAIGEYGIHYYDGLSREALIDAMVVAEFASVNSSTSTEVESETATVGESINL